MAGSGAPDQAALQERRAAGALASTSEGVDPAGGPWAAQSGALGREAGSVGQIELPSMPWSDWEIPAEQIAIAKRPDGSDWELGAGAFGKVWVQSLLPTPEQPAACLTPPAL
jgi:hypothetical protein